MACMNVMLTAAVLVCFGRADAAAPPSTNGAQVAQVPHVVVPGSVTLATKADVQAYLTNSFAHDESFAIGGSLHITGLELTHDDLAPLLSRLVGVRRSVVVSGTTKLTTLASLQSLEEVGVAIKIRDNTLLRSGCGLSGLLNSAGLRLDIHDNALPIVLPRHLGAVAETNEPASFLLSSSSSEACEKEIGVGDETEAAALQQPPQPRSQRAVATHETVWTYPISGAWPNRSAWSDGVPHGTSTAVIRGIKSGNGNVLKPYTVVVEPPGIAENGYHPAASIILSGGGSIALREGGAIDLSGTFSNANLPTIAPLPPQESAATTTTLPDSKVPAGEDGGGGGTPGPKTGGEWDDGDGGAKDDDGGGVGADNVNDDDLGSMKSSSVVGIVFGVLLLLIAIGIAVAVFVKNRSEEDSKHAIPRTATLSAKNNPIYSYDEELHAGRGTAIINATYDSVDTGAIANPTYAAGVGGGGGEGGESRPRLYSIPWAEGEAGSTNNTGPAPPEGVYIATGSDGYASPVSDATAAGAAATPGTTGEDGYEVASPYSALPDKQIYGGSMQHYDRIIAADAELYDPVYTMNPLSGLEETPVVSLATAVATAAAHCGGSGSTFEDAIRDAEDAASNLDRTDPNVVLGNEDAAVVNSYTQETPLYHGLNGALGGWGEGGRDAIPHYLPYAKLLFRAVRQLTVEPSLTLYRGVIMPASVLLGGSGVGDCITWWSFTSAARSPDVLRDENFLGIGKRGAKRGQRTVFQIRADAGVNIQPYSAISEEDEVLLLPGARFVIDAINEWAYGVTEVQMHQVASANFSTGSMEPSPYATVVPVYSQVNDYMMPTPLSSGEGGVGGGADQLPNYEPEAASGGGASSSTTTIYATPVEDNNDDYEMPVALASASATYVDLNQSEGNEFAYGGIDL